MTAMPASSRSAKRSGVMASRRSLRRPVRQRDCTSYFMTHLALLEGTGDGDRTTWLEPVTDDQYQAAQGQ